MVQHKLQCGSTCLCEKWKILCCKPVSYTHLDVYKRQVEEFLRPKIHTEKKKYKSPVEEQVSKTLITTGDSYFKI